MGFPLWNDSIKVRDDVNNQEDKIESKGSKNVLKK
jgi:hypothetical protein